MASKRIRNVGPVLRSRADVENTLGTIRDMTIEKNRISLDRESRIKAIEDEYKGRLGDIDEQLQLRTESVKAWADANPSEFAGARSIELTHAVVGYRTGQPQLKTLSGWTWDRVLEKLRDLAIWRPYIRTKEEVNKAQILADRDTLDIAELKAVGMRVVQDEAFFVDPKLEEIENRVAA